jgi:hypothetical protein
VRSPGGAARARHRALAIGILALALVVRALVIARGHQLDIDEADTALKVAKPVGALLDDLTRDGHPPLYFLLLKGWTAIFGRAEAALRALSALLSLGAIALAMRLGEGLFGAGVGLCAGLLYALSPIDIFHATEGRMYTLMPLVALAAFALLARLLRSRRRGTASAACLFATLVAGLYAHNYGLFLPVACAACVAAAAARSARARGLATAARDVALPAAAALLACAAYLPWLPTLQTQRASRAHAWLVEFFEAAPPILAVPRSLAALAATGPYPLITPSLVGSDILRPIAIPLALVLAVAGAAACARRRDAGAPLGAAPAGAARRDDARAARLAIPLFGAALLLAPWLVSLTVKVVYLVGRYDVIALPFALLLLAAGAGALVRANRALAVIPILFVAVLPTGVRALLAQRRGGDAVDQAAAIAARPESRALIATALSGSRLRYYLDRAGRGDVVVRGFPTSTDLHPGWLDRRDLADPAVAADAESLAAALHASLREGDLLWATLFDDDPTKPLLVRALARRFAADETASRLDLGLIAVRRE